MSKLLRSLTKNEPMSESLIFLVNRSFAHCGQKTSNSLGKPMSKFSALILGELQAECRGKASQEQHGEEARPLLTGVEELQHLREKLGGAAVL